MLELEVNGFDRKLRIGVTLIVKQNNTMKTLLEEVKEIFSGKAHARHQHIHHISRYKDCPTVKLTTQTRRALGETRGSQCENN